MKELPADFDPRWLFVVALILLGVAQPHFSLVLGALLWFWGLIPNPWAPPPPALGAGEDPECQLLRVVAPGERRRWRRRRNPRRPQAPQDILFCTPTGSSDSTPDQAAAAAAAAATAAGAATGSGGGGGAGCGAAQTAVHIADKSL